MHVRELAQYKYQGHGLGLGQVSWRIMLSMLGECNSPATALAPANSAKHTTGRTKSAKAKVQTHVEYKVTL